MSNESPPSKRPGYSSSEIQNHIKESKTLKTPIDEERRQEAKKLTRQHLDWLRNSTWADIKAKIAEIGIKPESEEYKELRELCRAVRRTCGRRGD